MLDSLLSALVESPNAAADDLLVDALRLGSAAEQPLALDALLQRKTPQALRGVILLFDSLSDSLKLIVLEHIGLFHGALRECGRHNHTESRIAAMRLIAIGRQGTLAYVLSENLHHPDEAISKIAVESLVALARWINTQCRQLLRGEPAELTPAALAAHQQFIRQRTEVESAVARALDVYRGRFGQDLLRAALLLADHPASRTLAILHTPKHGGQSALIRRLQQPPASECVDAFLLAAATNALRANFALTCSRITERPALDALLRRWYWLRNPQLAQCFRQVIRAPWLDPGDLQRDLDRRTDENADLYAEYVAASGAHDVVQDQLLIQLHTHAVDRFASRLRLLRCAMRRGTQGGVDLLKHLLTDPDERISRMAARELVRRRTSDAPSALMPLLTSAPASVRAVAARLLGREGFEGFWQRFDHMPRLSRKTAGKAVFTMLPDALDRLRRKIVAGDAADRARALQIIQELNLTDALSDQVVQLCSCNDAKLRSRAVSLIGQMNTVPSELLLDKVLVDRDPRVRANAIEVLEQRQQREYLPLLAQRARSAHNRERANAIKALHRMRVRAAGDALAHMLDDQRPDHRISAVWALRAMGFWRLLSEVARLARGDTDPRVRRYAQAALRHAAGIVRTPDSAPARKAG